MVPNPVAYRDLALLPDGDAAVLTSGLELRSYHYDAQSGTWDPIPRTLPVTANAVIASPRLGATADGLIAVWQESDLATSQRSIRAARFDPSAGQWTSSSVFADVAAVPAGGEAMLALDTAPPDHAIVVLDIRESRTVAASAYDVAAGRWTPQVLYDDGDVSPPHFASGGVDAFGRGWVTWAIQPPLADWEIHGRRFSGGWAATEKILTTFFVSSAAVTVADSGQTLLLSIEAGAPDMVLSAAVAEPDGPFSSGKILVGGFLAEGDSLRVATGPNGHTVAAWLTIPGGLRAAVIEW